MAVLYTPHFIQFFDDDGDPLSGGKLYTYEAGTSTPKATYTDAGGATPNANPVVLDAAGRATVFLSGSYKFTLTTSADVTIEETDNVSAFGTSISGGVSDITADYTDTAVAADDSFVFADVSDTDDTKRDTIQGIIDLAVLAVTPQMEVITTTGAGTFTTSANITSATVFKFTLVGGGGAGGGGATYGGSGGGAGGTVILRIAGLTASTGYTINVGAGTTGDSDGGATGGNTTLLIDATTYTASGGVGGVVGSANTSKLGGLGGAATNGTINIPGGDGSPGIFVSGSSVGGTGGASYFGGGGGGGLGSGTAGQDARAYGAGGGGGGGDGGDGRQGIFIAEWIE